MKHKGAAHSKRSKTGAAAVDLFCGAGGLSYGLQMAGIKIAAGIDIDESCKYPFERNVRSRFFEMDISELDPEFIDSLFADSGAKIVAGCAPCQPFSSCSNGKPSSKNRARWGLLYSFGKVIRRVRPEIVTMENVPQIKNHRVFDDFLSTLKKSGYHCSYSTIHCEKYGVPQTRRRMVLLASRLGKIEISPPENTDRTATVQSAIGSMEEISAGAASKNDPLHRSSNLSDINMRRVKESRPGGTWMDWTKGLQAPCHQRSTGRSYLNVYGRMEWRSPAPTITTEFYGFGSGRFGHPEQDRALSLREGSLLQTFPKDYEFVPHGGPICFKRIARMVGNAVPVKIGKVIGETIMSHLGEFNE